MDDIIRRLREACRPSPHRFVLADQLTHVRPELDVRQWPKAAPPVQGALL